jgi:hypothetical protein
LRRSNGQSTYQERGDSVLVMVETWQAVAESWVGQLQHRADPAIYADHTPRGESGWLAVRVTETRGVAALTGRFASLNANFNRW